MEPAQRLHRIDLVRSCRFFRGRCLCGRTRPDLFRPVALALDPDRGHAWRDRRIADRFSDLSAAGTLLRAGDARLPARHPLRLRMARLSGSHPADQARQSDCLYAIRRSAPLHAGGAGDDAGDHPAHAAHRKIAVRHGAACDQAERSRRGGRGNQHAGVEAAGHYAERGDCRGDRRVLRDRAARGDAAIGVRDAGVGTGADGRHVRRCRHRVGAGDWIGDPDSARRNAQRRSRLALPRHSGRDFRAGDRLRHPGRAGGLVLEGARFAAQAVGAAGCGDAGHAGSPRRHRSRRDDAVASGTIQRDRRCRPRSP